MAIKDTLGDVIDAAKDLIHEVVPTHADDADSEHGASAEHDAASEDDAAEALAEAHSEDAIEILKADHRRVEALFQEILAEPSSMLTSQKKNVAMLVTELTMHAKIEQSIVYPAAYAKTKRDTEERTKLLEAIEGYDLMNALLKRISKSAGRDETLKAKVHVLSELALNHFKESESMLFHEVKKLVGERKLKELGVEVAKVKARAARGTARKTTRATAKTTRAAAKTTRAAAKPARQKRTTR